MDGIWKKKSGLITGGFESMVKECKYDFISSDNYWGLDLGLRKMITFSWSELAFLRLFCQHKGGVCPTVRHEEVNLKWCDLKSQ